MIRKFFTRFHPRYLRSLVYMLQASEYHPGEYLAWLKRAEDFSAVENRKQLVKTNKALLMLAVAWVMLLSVFLLALSILVYASFPLNIIGFVFVLLAAPFIVGYGIVAPLATIRVGIQKPLEKLIAKKTASVLKNHLALKIGIAGSFGKTSMREILKTVLSESKTVAAPPGSYNTPLGISKFVKTLNGNEEILIFEYGEYYPGDVKELSELTMPDIGVITGVNEAHLEKFKTLEKTAATIFELADWLKEKPLYVNAENNLAKQKALPSHQLYSRAGIADLRVIDPITDLSGTRFALQIEGQEVPFTSGLLGMHQIGPLVAAIAIALRLGCPLAAIQQGVANTKPFSHRLELKTDAQGVTTLDDSYNGNPDGVKAVIAFLAELKGKRRFYVTPGLVEMGSATESVHRLIGKQLADGGIEKVILIRNSVTPFIEAGLKESNFSGELLWYEDALAAFAALPFLTVAGDVVLLQNDLPDQYA